MFFNEPLKLSTKKKQPSNLPDSMIAKLNSTINLSSCARAVWGGKSCKNGANSLFLRLLLPVPNAYKKCSYSVRLVGYPAAVLGSSGYTQEGGRVRHPKGGATAPVR